MSKSYKKALSSMVAAMILALSFFAATGWGAAPAAPVMTLTTSGLNVTVSWSTVTGATGYTLLYAPYPSATPIGSMDMGALTSFSATLSEGAAYYVAIKAYNASENSDYSNIDHFIMLSAPTGVSAVSSGNTVTVSWSAVSGATGYILRYGVSPGSYIGSVDIGSLTSQSFSSVPAGTYYLVVQAYEGSNVSGYSTETSVVVSAISTDATDIDGNVYNTVTIGTQTWMKENLKVTKYRNGDAIGTTPTATTDISTETSPKYQWAYDGNESNTATYGRLYTWYAATDSRGLCPTGWHVPTDTEWTTLTDYLGGESVASGKMKETGTTHWVSPNTGADNSSGFTALPGGYRYYSDGAFGSIGYYGEWWSATEDYTTGAWYRSLRYDDDGVDRRNLSKKIGYSVRCVRD